MKCFSLTVPNHSQVLKVIQKIFVEGMYKYLNMPKEIVERIFPCIDELIELHFKFLHRLRARQNEDNVVASIADILLEQFSGESLETCSKYFLREKNDLTFVQSWLQEFPLLLFSFIS